MPRRPTPPARRKPGRPVTINATRRQVSLDAVSWDRAYTLGNGNVSLGIRRALSIAVGSAHTPEGVTPTPQGS